MGGIPCRAGKRLLAAGDAIEIDIPHGDVRERRPAGPPPDLLTRPFFKKNFRILYQDAWILALDKPSGLAVHPGDCIDRRRLTLVDMAKAYVALRRPGAAPAEGSLFEPALVHRLDQQTSGVVLVAKTGEALRGLSEAFRAGAIEKEYLALVKGVPREEEGRVTFSLNKETDPVTGKPLVKVSRARHAKEADTLYTIEKAWRGAALLRVRILTGRMHQIRVHLAAIGHPVAGDGRYGDFAFNGVLVQRAGLRRLFLHAHRVAFAHPVTERPVEIEAPLPGELAAVLNCLTDKRL